MDQQPTYLLEITNNFDKYDKYKLEIITNFEMIKINLTENAFLENLKEDKNNFNQGNLMLLDDISKSLYAARKYLNILILENEINNLRNGDTK